MAETFLNCLAFDEGEAPCFSFQTYDDRSKNNKLLTRILHGPFPRFSAFLAALNEQGAGIHCTINKTDLRGRKADNIVKVRAFFVDLDGAELSILTKTRMVPNMIVQSSPGRYHAYWLTRQCPLSAFEDAQARLNALCHADVQVTGLSHCMRLPGFFHNKRDPPTLVECQVIHHGTVLL